MKYLLLPILLTILCLTGFTTQIQAQPPALMSLEHGGTTDVMGSREFIVSVCNEFEVELWIRDLQTEEGTVFIVVYISWNPNLMELKNVKFHLPGGWSVEYGPFEETDSYYVEMESGSPFSSNWKWMTFTFHCKGEGSSPINIPEVYENPAGGSSSVGPFNSYLNLIARTLLKAAITQTFEPAPVGGLVTPTNKLEILTPYIVMAGLIAAVSAVYVIKRLKIYK